MNAVYPGDPFVNRTFGATLRGGSTADQNAFAQINDTAMATTGTGVTSIDIIATVLTAQTPTADAYAQQLSALDAKTSPSAGAAREAHVAAWAAFWGRSFITMPGRGEDDDQRRVEAQYVTCCLLVVYALS